jgi:hypothetical protein
MPGEAWTDDELQRVGEAEELELSSVRSDETLRSARYRRYSGSTARITSVEARAARLKLVPR